MLDPRHNWANLSMLARVPEAGGYDPAMLRRYGELVMASQGRDPDRVLSGLPMVRVPAKLLALLRVELVWEPRQEQPLVRLPPGLPRALLVGDVEVARGRDAVIARVLDPSFDPRRSVVLEREPTPRPPPGPVRGAVRVTDAGTDFLELEAEAASAAVLVMTDAYSEHWEAIALGGSAQQDYAVVPANHALRAVALSPGHHRLRLEYRPPLVREAGWLSLVALFGWGAAVVAVWRTRRAASP